MENTNAVLGLLGAKNGMSEFQISLMEAITFADRDGFLNKGVALCLGYSFPKGCDGVKEASEGLLAMLVSSIGSVDDLVKCITIECVEKPKAIVTAVFGLLKIGGYLSQDRFREDWVAGIKGEILTSLADIVISEEFATRDVGPIHQGELSNLVSQFFRGQGFGSSFGSQFINHEDSHTMAKLMGPFYDAVRNTPVPKAFQGVHTTEVAFNVRLANELMSKYFLALEARNKVLAIQAFVTGNKSQ